MATNDNLIGWIAGWSIVCQSRPDVPRQMAALLWFGIDDSSTSVHFPLYGSATRIPKGWAGEKRRKIVCMWGISVIDEVYTCHEGILVPYPCGCVIASLCIVMGTRLFAVWCVEYVSSCLMWQARVLKME